VQNAREAQLRLVRWLFAAFTALLTPTQGGATSDPCLDPRIPQLGGNQECRSRPIPFLERGTEKPAEFIVLTYRYDRPPPPPGKFWRDPPDPANAFFLRPADQRLIQLPHNFSLDGTMSTFRGLGFAFNTPPGTFFDTVIESIHGEYCATHRMKSPLQGIYRHCGGQKPDLDTVGYQPGVLTRQAALQQTCVYIQMREQRRCEAHQSVSAWAKRDHAGTFRFIYVFKLPRRGPDAAPTDNEFLVYQINPISRAAEHLGTFNDEKTAINVARS
jgi:hypothetical protein